MIYRFDILTQKEEIDAKRAEDIPKQVIINGDQVLILTGDDMEVIHDESGNV